MRAFFCAVVPLWESRKRTVWPRAARLRGEESFAFLIYRASWKVLAFNAPLGRIADSELY